jgi:alpha-tubulin suppressor-like RCC1 family protein
MSKPPSIPVNLIPIGQKAWIPSSSTQLFYNIPGDIDLHVDAKLAYLPVTVKGYDQDRKFGQYTLDWDEKLICRCLVENALPRATKTPDELLLADESYDISQLEFSHDASIVWELMLKYKKQQYYSKVGSSSTILLFNPLESDTRLFNNPPTEIMNRSTKSRRRRSSVNIAASLPVSNEPKPVHDLVEDLQSFTSKIYKNFISSTLKDYGEAIVFQGCSGSGKSEAMKYTAQFVICQPSASSNSLDYNPKNPFYKPLGTTKNPIIAPSDLPYTEAFAMALRVFNFFTVAASGKNETSSRHIKRISLHYSDDNRLIGCSFDVIYIDYRRICHLDGNQRPYQMLQYLIVSLSADPSQCSKYKLTPEIIALYNTGLSNVQIDEVLEEFEYFIGSLLQLGLPQTSLTEIFNCLIACVHLQTIKFDGTDTAILPPKSKSVINTIEELLGMAYGSLAPIFLVKVDERVGSMRGTAIDCRPDEAITARDNFTHELYARVTKFLLNFCSQNISVRANGDYEYETWKTLHLIDPPGYEVLPSSEMNSLSQFNINFVYEKCSGYYVSSCFNSHRKKYADNPKEISGMEDRVAIDDDASFFIGDCLPYTDLFERPSTGLISILEDVSQAIRGDDKIFTDKVLSIHARNKQIRSAGHKATNTSFIVKHTFGDVSYDAAGFVMQNKSRLSLQAKTILATMTYAVIVTTGADMDEGQLMPLEDLLGDPSSPAATATRKRSSVDMNSPRNTLLMSRSREQMSKLCTMLRETCQNTHDVLCLRPCASSAGYFDPDCVLAQIRALYLSQLAQFMKSGYSWCKTYADFFSFFRPMLSPFHPLPRTIDSYGETISTAIKASCLQLLDIILSMASIGNIRIYDSSGIGNISSSNAMYKDDHMILLSKHYICLKERVSLRLLNSRMTHLNRMQRVVVKLQSYYRMRKLRKHYRGVIIKSITKIQAYARRYIARRRYQNQRKHLLVLQRTLRMIACRSRFQRRKRAALRIKTYIFHKVLLQLRYRHMQRLISQLQALAHGYRDRQHALYIQKAVTVVKHALRIYVHRVRIHKKKQIVIVSIQRMVRGHLIRLQQHRIVNILTLRRKQRIAQKVVVQIQAIFRRRYHHHKYQKLVRVTRHLQYWVRARFLRQRFLLTKYLSIWVQKQWRRLQSLRKVSNMRMAAMVLLEQTRIWKFKAQELAYLHKATSDPKKLAIGQRTYKAGNTKATRRVIGFDAYFDMNDVYTSTWMKSLVDFIDRLKDEEKKSVSDVTIGGEHTIILDSNANLYSFGSGDSGQLGHNNRHNLAQPSRMETMALTIHASEASFSANSYLIPSNPKLQTVQVVMICCGRAHTLLLGGSGRMYSWGNNRRGQLGHSHFENCALPRMVGQDLIESAFDKSAAKNAIISRNVKYIACGAYHSACIADPGYLYTWGAGSCLGRTRELVGGNTLKGAKMTMTGRKEADSTCPDCAEPSIPAYFSKKRVQAVTCGDAHTAVRSYTDFYSWGRNSHGQLGIGDFNDTLLPTRINLPTFQEAETAISSLASGGRHMALLVRGKVWCWGWNISGQVGNGSTENVSSPIQVTLPDTVKRTSIKQVVAGWQYTAAMTNTNQVLLWGKLNLLGEPFPTTYDEMIADASGKIPPKLTPQLISIAEEDFGHNLGLYCMNSATMSVLAIDSDDFSAGQNRSQTLSVIVDSKANSIALASATLGNRILSSSATSATPSPRSYSRSTSPALSLRSFARTEKEKAVDSDPGFTLTRSSQYRTTLTASDTSQKLLRVENNGPVITELLRSKLGSGISPSKLKKRRSSFNSTTRGSTNPLANLNETKAGNDLSPGDDDSDMSGEVQDPKDDKYAKHLQRRMREGELADNAIVDYFSLSRRSKSSTTVAQRPTLLINTSATAIMSPFPESSPLNPATALSAEEREEFDRLKLAGRGINMPASERNILLKFTNQRRESQIKHLNDLVPSIPPSVSPEIDLFSAMVSLDPNSQTTAAALNPARNRRPSRGQRRPKGIKKSIETSAANRLGLSAESVRSLNNAIDSLRLDIRQLEYPRSRRSIGSLLPSSSSKSVDVPSIVTPMRATTGSIGLSKSKASKTGSNSMTSPANRSPIKRQVDSQTKEANKTMDRDFSPMSRSVRLTSADNDQDTLHASDVRDLAVLLQTIKRENIQQIAGSWKY